MPYPPKADEWHYAYGASRSTTDDDLSGHGSCVASKAAGWKTGVSKNSQLVVMKSLPTLADINFAFAAALDDIIVKRRQGKAVVLYPANSIQTFNAKSPLPRNWQSVWELMQDLFAQNVVLVTGSGNNAARSPVLDTVPAMWASYSNFPLIVAGAAKLDGTVAPFSQGWAMSSEIVWAPGDNIVCANGPSSPGLAVRSGTSFAAAMVIVYSPTLATPAAFFQKKNILTKFHAGRRPRRLRTHRRQSPGPRHHRQQHPRQNLPRQQTYLSTRRTAPHLERNEWGIAGE